MIRIHVARGVKPLMSSRLRGEGVDAGRHYKIREDFILGRQIYGVEMLPMKEVSHI